MNGKKVIMLKSDSFGRKGWTGVIEDENPLSHLSPDDVVRVFWDNGRSYLHNRTKIGYLDQGGVNEPNLAFLMQKRGHKP